MRYRDNKGPPANVLDPELYLAVKEEAKEKFDVYPSIYANSWLVREYKARGGRYADKKNNSDTGLKKWYEEKWVDMSRPMYDAAGNIVDFEQCGRQEAHHITEGGDYPKCRPKSDVMHMSDYEREMAVINKQIAEYSSPKTKGRKPTMVKTRSNPIEVIIDDRGELKSSKYTNVRRLQSKNYAAKITEAFKKSKNNFRYYVYPNEVMDFTPEFLSKLSSEKYITLVASQIPDEDRREQLRIDSTRTPSSNRARLISSLGPITMLHDVVEHFFVSGSPLFVNEYNEYAYTISSTGAEAVVRRAVMSIMKNFRVVERSSPEVEQVIMSLMDNFGNLLVEASKRTSHSFIDNYVRLGVNSFMSKKGISGGAVESTKDAIALCELTERPRPIFLSPDELSKDNIEYLTGLLFPYEDYEEGDDDHQYYIRSTKYALSGFNAVKLSECLRDIFDLLFPFMYGAVFCVSRVIFAYVPDDLPRIDLK
jgi:hypothetical protein